MEEDILRHRQTPRCPTFPFLLFSFSHRVEILGFWGGGVTRVSAPRLLYCTTALGTGDLIWKLSRHFRHLCGLFPLTLCGFWRLLPSRLLP